jgi:hypothetical protein
VDYGKKVRLAVGFTESVPKVIGLLELTSGLAPESQAARQ